MSLAASQRLINALLKTKARIAVQPEDAEPGVEFPQSRDD